MIAGEKEKGRERERERKKKKDIHLFIFLAVNVAFPWDFLTNEEHKIKRSILCTHREKNSLP